MWNRLGDLIRVPLVRRVVLLAVIVAAYQMWLGVQAVGKVDDGVGQDPDSSGRFSVDVRLGFPPERFHILRLQEHGRIAGSDDDVVHLRSVSDAGVDALARLYWIDEITPSADDREKGVADGHG